MGFKAKPEVPAALPEGRESTRLESKKTSPFTGRRPEMPPHGYGAVV